MIQIKLSKYQTRTTDFKNFEKTLKTNVKTST